MPEVAAATEEAREEVEGVMALLSAALAALFQTFVAVLVVDFAGLGVREGFVGFGYLDEFLFGGFVTSRGEVLGYNRSIWGKGELRVLIRVVFLAKGAVCTLDIAFRGLLVYSKKLQKS